MMCRVCVKTKRIRKVCCHRWCGGASDRPADLLIRRGFAVLAPVVYGSGAAGKSISSSRSLLLRRQNRRHFRCTTNYFYFILEEMGTNDLLRFFPTQPMATVSKKAQHASFRLLFTSRLM